MGTERTPRRGEIYYVRSTETVGSEQSGERPAIVVSNDTGNRHGPIVEVVFLTTQDKARLPTHVRIRALRPSVAICEQITTVDKSRLERYVGRISNHEMRKINEAMSVSLDLTQEDWNGSKDYL